MNVLPFLTQNGTHLCSQVCHVQGVDGRGHQKLTVFPTLCFFLHFHSFFAKPQFPQAMWHGGLDSLAPNSQGREPGSPSWAKKTPPFLRAMLLELLPVMWQERDPGRLEPTWGGGGGGGATPPILRALLLTMWPGISATQVGREHPPIFGGIPAGPTGSPTCCKAENVQTAAGKTSRLPEMFPVCLGQQLCRLAPDCLIGFGSGMTGGMQDGDQCASQALPTNPPTTSLAS